MPSRLQGRHRDNPRSSGEGVGALLSPDELSAFLGVPVTTIYRWRTRREGPSGFKIGRHVRYSLTEVQDWLETRRDQDPLSHRVDSR